MPPAAPASKPAPKTGRALLSTTPPGDQVGLLYVYRLHVVVLEWNATLGTQSLDLETKVSGLDNTRV